MEELIYSNMIEQVHPLIVPTVLIPLTLVSMGISVIATFIAGLFGVKLKAEGPKRLLELLFKPKILISALILNTVFMAGYWGYNYINNMPAFLFNIHRINQKNLKPQKTINYSSVLERPRSFEIHNKTQFIKKITQQKLIKLDGGVFRAGAVSGQSVFFGTSKGNTFEIDRANNEIKREFYTGTFLTPGPLIWNNSLIIGEGTHDIHHARIYFYDLLTGKLTKSFTTKGHTEGQATIGTYKNKTLLFAVAGSDGVYALDPTSHDKDNNVSVKWHEIVGHTDASVAIADGVVFVGTGREKGNAEKYKTYAAAHEFNTGKLLWKRELPASSWMKPITISSLVCFVYGEVYFKSQLGGLQCFDQKSGEPKQSYHTTQPVITIPIRVGHRIYFSDLKGTIHAIDTKKKSILWRAKTKAAKGLAFAGLSYDEHRNVLVFASKKNGLFVFDPLSGKTIHNWVPKKEETEWKKTYASVTITKEGWWVADMKGNLRFLKLQFN